jgi:hypothetical protein
MEDILNTPVPRMVIAQQAFQRAPAEPLDIGEAYTGIFGNPKMLATDRELRPRLPRGSNNWQTQDHGQAMMWGSLSNRRGQFYAPFASPAGFNSWKLQHPKSPYTFTSQDIDGDKIDDAVVKDDQNRYISVNGMGMKTSNWGAMGPYYERRTQKRIGFEKRVGLRDEDGKLVIAGIAKAFRDNYLKDIYESILDPAKFQDEDTINRVKAIRKAVPMGFASKVFVRNVMDQEAAKYLESKSQIVNEANIKRVKALKLFKVSIARMLGSAAKNNDTLQAIKRSLRDTIYNETPDHIKLETIPTWDDFKIVDRPVVDDVFEE